MTFLKTEGTQESTFQVGNTTGPKLKDDTNAVGIRNAGDTAYETLRADRIASGAGQNDIPALSDLQARFPNIAFSFTGASAPSAGTNTGLYGFCHTTGGAYTAGQVVYDTGTELTLQPTEVCRAITTSVVVTGTISLIQNGLYALVNSTWTLMGDGGSSATGLNRTIEVEFDYNDANSSVDSTTTIPSGARVLDSRVLIETGFDNPPVITSTVQGATPVNIVVAGDVTAGAVQEFQIPDTHVIGASNTGVVRVSLSNTSPSVGAGRIIVQYVTPSV